MAMTAPEERVKNPLEIPEVLNYVLSRDLMNAREVAKLWRDWSLDNFRSSIVYVLDPDTEAQLFLRMSMKIEANGGGSTTMPGEDASSSSPSGMYNFQDKPIKKYRLTGPQEITPDGFISLALGSMPYFWNQYGSHLTYLDLKGATYLFESSFIDALISFFKLCPNLEEQRISPLWVNDDYGAFHRRNYANEEPILDEVLISHERSWTVYTVRGPSKAQLARMKECLALKMKSLSIELTRVDDRKDPDFDDYSARCFYSILWRCLFILMPNLKKLSQDGALYIFVMEALPRKTLTTNQLIQLESFEYNGEKSGPSDIDFGKGLVPLGCYLRELETVTSPVPFKDLKLLKIPFRSVWGYPKTFRNILFLIRARIEALCIELRCSCYAGLFNHT